jgi:hypothetical protein
LAGSDNFAEYAVIRSVVQRTAGPEALAKDGNTCLVSKTGTAGQDVMIAMVNNPKMIEPKKLSRWNSELGLSESGFWRKAKQEPQPLAVDARRGLTETDGIPGRSSGRKPSTKP